MSDVKLDSGLFFRRAEKIFSAWEVSSSPKKSKSSSKKMSFFSDPLPILRTSSHRE